MRNILCLTKCEGENCYHTARNKGALLAAPVSYSGTVIDIMLATKARQRMITAVRKWLESANAARRPWPHNIGIVRGPSAEERFKGKGPRAALQIGKQQLPPNELPYRRVDAVHQFGAA